VLDISPNLKILANTTHLACSFPLQATADKPYRNQPQTAHRSHDCLEKAKGSNYDFTATEQPAYKVGHATRLALFLGSEEELKHTTLPIHF